MAEEEEAPLNDQPRAKRNYYVMGGLVVAFLVCCIAVAAYVALGRSNELEVDHGPFRSLERPNGCRCVYVGLSKEAQPEYDLGGYICVCPVDKKPEKKASGL